MTGRPSPVTHPVLDLAPTFPPETPMHTLPEFRYIVMLLGFFVAVFLVSNLVARARGYRE